ncbi:MAG: aldehyde dehydrogenase family protein [Myxococcota bacterium]
MTTAEYSNLVNSLRGAWSRGKTRDLRWRKNQLKALIALCTENEDALAQALHEDLRKPRQEAIVTDIYVNRAEAEHALQNLEYWVQPVHASVPLALQPASAEYVYEPYGVTLIIAPWNFPVQLALQPLVASIAAGNCAVVKPSELAPATSEQLAQLIPKYLDTECIAVVEGGVPETTALLEQRFDKIFYTGNGHVARIVMSAAAKHLTPVSLELGGKSPAFVDGSLSPELAARRIAWGRFINSGQTCVAPDYVLVERSHKADLIQSLKKAVQEFYGEDPKASSDFGRIISARHFERLRGLLDSQPVAFGGDHDAEQRYIAPTVLDEPAADSPVMQEEIFGPILPVLTYEKLEDAIQFVNERDKPLALYAFSKKKKVQRAIVEQTSSGGVLINDTVMHLGALELPFGGVGESGMGSYHGIFGFQAFSMRRAVMNRATFVDVPLRYPPYSESKLTWVKRLL